MVTTTRIMRSVELPMRDHHDLFNQQLPVLCQGLYQFRLAWHREDLNDVWLGAFTTNKAEPLAFLPRPIVATPLTENPVMTFKTHTVSFAKMPDDFLSYLVLIS